MNRKDLAETVEKQKEQISRYENKLRDVVRAYKALQKERDALQTGLSALSSGSASQLSAEKSKDHPQGSASISDSASKGTDSTSGSVSSSRRGSKTNSELNEESPDVQKISSDNESLCSQDATQEVSQKSVEEQHQQNLSDLQIKLQNLTHALTQMTAEKERQHKSFMLERKKLNEEKEKVLSNLQKSIEVETTTKNHVTELRQRIVKLQADRDADADDSVLRLRECQKALSEQREAKEKAELKLQQTQHKLLQKTMHQTASKQETSQHSQMVKQISQLKNVICQLETQVTNLNKDLKSKDDAIRQLDQLNASTATQLHQESIRVQESERELARVLVSSREREANLEARLTEAATCFASKTTADASLSANILQYKARIRELTDLNQELSHKLNSIDSNKRGEVNSSEDSIYGNTSDISQMISQLKKLWLHIHLQNLSQAHQNEIENMVGGSDVLHETCKQKQNSLLQQILELQQQTQSDSKNLFNTSESSTSLNSGSRNASSNSTNISENSEYISVRKELRNVTAAAQVTETAHTAQIDSLKQEIRSVRSEYEERLLSAQQSHRSVVCSLEQQLTSQRLHSIATLQERDVELHRLQQQLHTLNMENSQAKVPTALVCSTNNAARSGPLLHHVEELQRREQEVACLQHEKMQLENAVREVQHAALEKRMVQEDRLTHLELQLERFERNQSRESQNLEYLKNVILHFLTSSNTSGDIYSRSALVKAVAAVLKLSPQEEDKLRRNTIGATVAGGKGADGGGWWFWGNGGSSSRGKK